MSVEAVLPCCCNPSGPCCPCHAALGYPTSRLVTWTGSIAISRPVDACVAIEQIYGPIVPPNCLTRYTQVNQSSRTISGFSGSVGWQNVFDPLNCNPVQPAQSQSDPCSYEEWVSDCGFCFFDSGPFSSSIRLRARAAALPPQGTFSNCPPLANPILDRWRILISFSGMGVVITPGSGSLGAPSLLFVSQNPGSCNPGSFQFVPPNPNDPFDPYASSLPSGTSGVGELGGLVTNYQIGIGTVSLT